MAKQPKKPVEDPDADLLERINDRYRYALNRWEAIRREGATDVRYVAGDPWSPQDRQQRVDAGRPCLSLDELGQYLNQVVNEVRANPRAMKFSPTGDGANDDTAEFYANKAREIEYRSKAQVPYTTAFQNAVERGYGFVRLNTKYVSERSFDQELEICEVANPDTVLPDPDAMKPDASDMKYCFVVEERTKEEFLREFPDAEVRDFSREIMSAHADWITTDKVQIAEYWEIECEYKRLVLLQAKTGETVEAFDDELTDGKPPKGWKIVKEREAEVPTVKQYLTNGVEILKRADWAGKYIPISACYGKILWVDQGSGPERTILSMTRLARDPYMLYCYYRTCEAELVGMTPKFPYFVIKGALDTTELANLQKSLHQPVAVIQVNPNPDGLAPGQGMPFPQRQPYEPPIQALEIGAEAARRAIQAAMGLSPLPTSAQRHNEKSGIALKQIEDSGQRGSYHFIDHYNDMIQHVGVMIEDLMDKIYDTQRDLGVVKADGTSELMRVNDPQVDPKKGLPSLKGRHAVTISTGPDFASEREQASDFADTLVGSQMVMQVLGPEKAQKVIAKAIKLKNVGPVGDQMAEIIDPQQKDGAQIPPQAQQMIQQANQMLQMAQQKIQEQGKIIETDSIKAQADMQKAQLDAQVRVKVAEIGAGSKSEAVAGKSADTDAQNQVELRIAQMEQQMQAMELALKGREVDLKLAHEVNMAHLGHEQAEAGAEMAHERGMESAAMEASEPEAE